jgi:hypothetical protein
LEDIGEVFIQYGHAVNKIVRLATVAQNIFEAPYLMVAYLDFPAFYLCLLHQLYQGVLIIPVIVKGKTERLAACVHTSLSEVQPSFPTVPDNTFLGKLNKVTYLLAVGIILLAA